MALAPAVPDAAPGGAGNTSHIVAVAAGYSAVILAVSNPSQVHQTDNTAGVVLLSGDCSCIDTGCDNCLGLISEVQGAVAFPDQIVLRVKVVFNSHRAHDPGHINIALHCSVIPGVREIARICSFRRFVRHILKPILKFLIRTIQNIPHQVGNDTELPVDGVQIVQQNVRIAGPWTPEEHLRCRSGQ